MAREELRVARRWKRLLSVAIDLFIINFVLLAPFSSLIALIIPSTSFAVLSLGERTLTRLSMVLLVMACFVVLYFALFEYFLGQSPGKAALRLIVRSRTGQAIRLWQALCRHLVWLPLFPFVLLWLLDPLWFIFSSRRLSESLTRTNTFEVVR